MEFDVWIIDHLVELILTIVLSFTLYFVIQIKNQKITVTDSPGSVSLIECSNVTLGTAQGFLNEIKDEGKTKTMYNPNKENDDVTKSSVGKDELIKKIEQGLDEDKPITDIVRMSLRLARLVKSEKDIMWFESELEGFDIETQEDSIKGGLKMRKFPEYDPYDYRKIVAKLNLHFPKIKENPYQSFELPLFLSVRISSIELLTQQQGAELVMEAPPPSLMVESFKMNPEENIPYIINKMELSKLTNGLKNKIGKFVDSQK